MSLFKGKMDLTIGSPVKNIVIFMIPMLIGNLAQQLYSTVDSIIVGEFVGDNALAAVGGTAAIFNLLLVLFVGISVGANVVVSQHFGNKDAKNIAKAVSNCIILTGIASLALMIIGPFAVRPLLVLLQTPEIIIDWSETYLVIMLLGVAGMAYFNILSGVMRGLGDSVSPLKYLLIATALNIVLDLLFVAVFKMGVAGVAYATVIAQFVSAILCFRKMFRMKDVFVLNMSDLKLIPEHVSTIVRLGVPSGLTQMIFSMAMLILQPLTNSHGEVLIAANVIVMRIDAFAIMPNLSFGTAMTTYSGQNVGASKYDRVLEGAKKGTFVAMGCAAFLMVVILLFGKNLVLLFTDTPQLIQMCGYILSFLAFGYIPMAVSQSLCGIMRGAGDTMTPMWISIATTVFIRVPLAYIWTFLTKTPEMPNGDMYVIFYSLLTSWCAGGIITFFVYKRGKWKDKAINQ